MGLPSQGQTPEEHSCRSERPGMACDRAGRLLECHSLYSRSASPWPCRTHESCLGSPQARDQARFDFGLASRASSAAILMIADHGQLPPLEIAYLYRDHRPSNTHRPQRSHRGLVRRHGLTRAVRRRRLIPDMLSAR